MDASCAYNTNPESLSYSVKIINNRAERELREDFVHIMQKSLPNSDKMAYQGILQKASDFAVQAEDEYCGDSQRKLNLPVLQMWDCNLTQEFEVNFIIIYSGRKAHLSPQKAFCNLQLQPGQAVAQFIDPNQMVGQ